eukprot:scaffold154623_cov28-Tisochrysis_lutea.AAC.2
MRRPSRTGLAPIPLRMTSGPLATRGISLRRSLRNLSSACTHFLKSSIAASPLRSSSPGLDSRK